MDERLESYYRRYDDLRMTAEKLRELEAEKQRAEAEDEWDKL